jgi:predicted chitinase
MSTTHGAHMRLNAHVNIHFNASPGHARHALPPLDVGHAHRAGLGGGTPPALSGQQGMNAARPFVPSQLQDGFEVASARTGRAGPVGDGHPDTAGGVTASQLKAIMPGLTDAKANAYLPHLNAAMKEAGITTPRRQAMFLAQVGHESGGLKWMEELSSGRQYQGRRDLGNVHPGDGVRFKGRGPIQLTGRANYASAGRALGLDLVNNPRQVATPEVGFRTAAWFWKEKGINAAADRMDLKGATRPINPGLRNLADRAAFYARAKRALGL